MANEGSRPALFMGALLGSFVGYVLLVATSFGGWYNYGYYVQSWGWVEGWWLAPLGIPLLGAGLLSLQGLRSPATMTRARASGAFFLALTQLILVLVGAGVFVALVSENSDWWFDAGFYGSAIGSLVAVLCLGVVRGTYPPGAPGPMPYPAPPVQPGVYGPPPALGYAPPPIPVYAPPPTAPSYAPPASSYAPYAPPPAYAPPPPPPPLPTVAAPAPAANRYCARCGAPLAAGQRFCASCGSQTQ